MARILRLLTSRYGIALALIVGMGAIVGIGKAIGGSAPPPAVTNAQGASPAPTVLSSEDEDDGVDAPEATPAPSTSRGATPPVTLATDFVTAWLKHTNVTPQAWLAGMRKYITDNLAGELDGVDPAGVPASKVTGRPTLIDHDTGYVDATVPVDGGTVTLRLIATSGRWLVDGVDWDRS